MQASLNRREVFLTFAAVAFTTLQLSAAEPGAPLFFSKEDFALLDSLTDLIIPTDDHSPGAHAAGVAAFIDRMVAEAFVPEDKTSWTKGLASVNRLAQEMHHAPFMKCSAGQQKQVLTAMSKKEDQGDNGEQGFFGQLKNTTAFVYYSSSIGIHQEMNYKGNVVLEEFVGFDAS